MAAVPSYRELSQRTLGQAASELNELPNGRVSAAEMQARSTKAQAVASIAIAQALLEIGDVLRDHLK